MTPDSIPRKDIVASVEQSISGLLAAAQDEMRVGVSHTLKNTEERQASENEQHNKRRAAGADRSSAEREHTYSSRGHGQFCRSDEQVRPPTRNQVHDSRPQNV